MSEFWVGVWRWINFLTLVALTVWLVRKIDVGAMLQKRREHIKAELDQAQKLQQEAAALKAQAEDELATADTKAKELLQDARQRGERIQEDIRRQAEAEAKRILEQARLEAEMEHQRILKEVQRETFDKALERTAEVLKQELTPADQAQLVRDFLKALDKEALTV